MKKLWWFPAVAVIASVLLLVGFTHSQMGYRQEMIGREINNMVRSVDRTLHISSVWPHRERALDAMQQLPVLFGNYFDAVVMLFHEDTQQLLEVTRVGLPDWRPGWEYDQLEALMHARATATLRVGDGSMSSVGPYGEFGNVYITTEDEGTFVLIWIAQAQISPLRATMRQLIPIYVMTALLLMALIFTQQKLKTTPKENLDV